MADLLTGQTLYCQTPLEVIYEPGSEFQYSDASFCVIQQVVEDATGQPFEQIMHNLIFDPLHIAHSCFPITNQGNRQNFACGHDKEGNVVDGKYPLYPYAAAAGLWTTPSGLAAVLLEVMHSLKSKSKIGYSQKLIREMLTPQGCSPWTGLGVFLDNSNTELKISSLGWGVGFQCIMIAYPYMETGVIIMTNADVGVHQMKGLIGEIVQTAFPQMT